MRIILQLSLLNRDFNLTRAPPDSRLRWAAWDLDLQNHDPAAGELNPLGRINYGKH